MAQKQKLTVQEENVIKDILKVIGRDTFLNTSFASAVGLSEKQFDALADEIFKKLGNGRVTVEEGNLPESICDNGGIAQYRA
jgi:hypothetical protein